LRERRAGRLWRRGRCLCGGRHLLRKNVERFQGGLVFKAHRRLYHSTLGLRVMKKQEEKIQANVLKAPARSPRPTRGVSIVPERGWHNNNPTVWRQRLRLAIIGLQRQPTFNTQTQTKISERFILTEPFSGRLILRCNAKKDPSGLPR